MAFGVDESVGVAPLLPGLIEAAGAEERVVVEVVAVDQPWPAVGAAVGAAVAGGRADVGVVACWTGTGVSIAANKVPGVRAALCTDAETARGARRWNDANVLALGLRLLSAPVAEEILAAFLTTPVDEDERATILAVEP